MKGEFNKESINFKKLISNSFLIACDTHYFYHIDDFFFQTLVKLHNLHVSKSNKKVLHLEIVIILIRFKNIKD